MSSTSGFAMVDGHVHFHHGFEARPFLENAHANFENAARGMSLGASFVGILLLTEGEQENGFERLIAQVEQQTGRGEGSMSKWRMQDTEEQSSVCFTAQDRFPIIVVAGRQIPTRERLEILAVGTRREFEKGRPIRGLIQRVAQAGALPVVPWGAGKWMGERGRLVDELIRSSELPPFFLGDSGNRPAFWPRPTHFCRAEEEGIKILSGSDPLPFSGEAKRVGSFGVVLKGSLDAETPAQDLKRRVLNPSTVLHPFGGEETPLRFVRNQLKMQFRKLIR